MYRFVASPRCVVVLGVLLISGFASEATARQVHGTTRTSVGGSASRSASGSASGSASRSANVNASQSASVNSNVNANRSANVNSNVNANRNVNVNSNTNVNSNVNVNRNVNVDVDVDNHWDAHYHPVARTAAVTTAVAITAAAIGSVAYSIPPSCVTVVVNGATYQQCGSTWYQPRYAGTSVQYIVVTAPH